jgi:hypothetical protein
MSDVLLIEMNGISWMFQQRLEKRMQPNPKALCNMQIHPRNCDNHVNSCSLWTVICTARAFSATAEEGVVQEARRCHTGERTAKDKGQFSTFKQENIAEEIGGNHYIQRCPCRAHEASGKEDQLARLLSRCQAPL